MSLICNGTTQYLNYSIGGTPLVAYPFSVGICFKMDNVTTNGAVVSIGWLGYSAQNVVWAMGAVEGDYAAAGTYKTGWGVAYTTAGYTAGTWYHALAVFNSATDRRIYLNGANKGTDATDQNAGTNNNSFLVGCRNHTGAKADYVAGRLAHFAVWNNIALSDADAIALAGGANPQDVQGGNLTQYNNLNSNALATVGLDLTENGTPTYDSDDNPPVSGILVGSVSGQSVASATLESVQTLVGSSTGQSAVSAALESVKTLTGSSTGQSTVSASLGLYWAGIAGSIVGQSSVFANITSSQDLIGAISGQSTVSGTIEFNPAWKKIAIENTSPTFLGVLLSKLTVMEASTDPLPPNEGESIVWMSDGTGFGDDGDMCAASTVNGVTTKVILFDKSSGDAW